MTADSLHSYFARSPELWQAFSICGPVLCAMLKHDQSQVQPGTDNDGRMMELATYRIYSRQIDALESFMNSPLPSNIDTEPLVPHGH